MKLWERVPWCAKCGLEWPTPTDKCTRCGADATTWREVRSVYLWTLWIDQFTTVDVHAPHHNRIFVARLLEVITFMLLSLFAMVFGIMLVRPVSIPLAHGIGLAGSVFITFWLIVAIRLGSSSPLLEWEINRIGRRNNTSSDES